MAAIPRTWKRRTVKFPDPVEQAQVVFATRPEDMRTAYKAKQSFLQSCSDYKNMMSGVDFSNQRLFQTVTDKLTETDFRKMLPWTETGIKSILETPEVKALIDQAKTGFDSRILSTVKPELETLESKIDKAVGKPVKIPNSFIVKQFAKADLVEVPLFEIAMDPAGPEKGLMGIFIELGSKSYFELLPRDSDYKGSICAYNDKNEKLEKQLTEEFCEVLTENKTIPNDIMKSNYLEFIAHTVGDKIGDIIHQFQTGQKPGERRTDDDVLIEEYKLQAAELIGNWGTKSVKFREWIAPLYPKGNTVIDDAKKFVEEVNEDASKLSTTFTETPKMRRQLRSETKRKQELETSEFKTPLVKSDAIKSEYRLSPEGKTFLDYLKLGTDKKTAKQKIKQMAKDNPDKFGQYVEKKGDGVRIKKILVPPSKLARFERIKVILGALEADSTADYVEEYTAIVDSLLTDKMINKDQHKFLIQKYFDCK